MTASGRTDVGLVRERNEDRVLVGSRLFVVADGVGGHRAGDVASSMLVAMLDDLDVGAFADADEAQAALLARIGEANDRIHHRAGQDAATEGMATTVTAGLVVGRRLVLAQVGDTRAYLLRAGEPIRRLTPDHSFVGALVDGGYLTEEEARSHPKRSVILRAVGLDPTVEADVGEVVDLQHDDRLLLVSDGAHGVLDDSRLTALVADVTPAAAVDAVVDAAREAGGPDNITAIVVHVVDDG